MTLDPDSLHPEHAFTVVNCPSCGSPICDTYLIGSDRDHDVEGEFRLVRCLACRLVYQNPRPSARRLARHYRSDYFPYRDTRGRSFAKTVGWRHGYELYRRCRFVARHKRAGRLLDIGCAGGTFLEGIQGFGSWEALWGVEMDLRMAKLARSRGFDVVVARAEEFQLPEAELAVVTMWDVLEHLPGPVDRLAAVRRSLAADGMLFLSVPNLDSIDARLFGSDWVGLDLPRHLLVPGRAALRALLGAAGFEVVAMSHPTGSHYSFTASLARRVRRRLGDGAPAAAAARIVRSGAVKLALAPCFLAVEKTGRGANLSVAARPTTQR